MDIIRIRPATALREEFAAWAVAQKPKVRTVSPADFGVPAPLYVQMPEPLLLGATVDGQSYVPVADTVDTPELPQVEPKSEAPGLPAAPTSDVLLGVATPEAFTAASVVESGTVDCGDCDRSFANSRALKAHRRQAHPAPEVED